MRSTLIALLAGLAFAPAAWAQYAPLDRPGPALSPSARDLAGSLACSVPLEGVTRDPILLLAGTTVDSETNFAWNYKRALTAEKIPWCALDQPGELAKNLGDIQVRGEYIVWALREMHRRSGRRVVIYGHSQGGMVTRWALRFWPDTRALVSDLVGAAPSNHGTVLAIAACSPSCPEANWQQRTDAQFIAALNSGQETFAGIDYTAVYSNHDEVVIPATGARLSGPGRITNLALQDVCPADPSEHLNIGTADAVMWALFKDAIEHDGPADPSRLEPTICATPFMPGVNPATFLTDAATAYAQLMNNLSSYPTVDAEPALACYVPAQSVCVAGTSGPVAGPPAAPCRRTRRVTLRVDRAANGARLRGVTVTVGGRPVKLRRRGGRLVAVFVLRNRRAGTVRVVIRGRTLSGRRVTRVVRLRTCVGGSR